MLLQSHQAVGQTQSLSHKETGQAPMMTFANGPIRRGDPKLSTKKMNELLLQRNTSIKIEQEKKLSQQKQMIVQALQWEVTNQQLKAICDYERHLEDEQARIGNLEAPDYGAEQSELEIKNARQELQYYKKQRERVQTQLQQLKLNGKIEYI